MAGAGTKSSTKAITSGERLETRHRRDNPLRHLRAIGLATGCAVAGGNFSSLAVRVIGRTGCPYITSFRSVSLLPSRSVISTVAEARVFGSPSRSTGDRRDAEVAHLQAEGYSYVKP